LTTVTKGLTVEDAEADRYVVPCASAIEVGLLAVSNDLTIGEADADRLGATVAWAMLALGFTYTGVEMI